MKSVLDDIFLEFGTSAAFLNLWSTVFPFHGSVVVSIPVRDFCKHFLGYSHCMCTVLKKLSKETQNCGDTRPVVGL